MEAGITSPSSSFGCHRSSCPRADGSNAGLHARPPPDGAGAGDAAIQALRFNAGPGAKRGDDSKQADHIESLPRSVTDVAIRGHFLVGRLPRPAGWGTTHTDPPGWHVAQVTVQ